MHARAQNIALNESLPTHVEVHQILVPPPKYV